MMAETSEANPGLAVDAQGDPVVDPTRNVLNLVQAAIRRQDDLRAAEQAHIREVLELRTNLGEQDSKCAAEIAELRALHAAELRLAEAARIDAIRDVDVKAVQQAAAVQAAQAAALAATVTASAEAMRTQVAAAAEAATQSQATALEPITKSIEDLRRSQYEALGQKTQVVETQARGANVGLWVGLGVAAVAVFVSVLAAVAAVAITALT